MKTFQVYPRELEALEAGAILKRRAIIAGPRQEPEGPMISAEPPRDDAASEKTAPQPDATDAEGCDVRLPRDAIGLALSGGGIRSATFCLGVVQSLAQRGLLRHMDFMSTVSGGGYLGAFLGRFYDRQRESPALAANVVEAGIANSSSAPIRWLRKHGKYIAPAGKSDWWVDAAIFLRNILTLHLVVGLLVFAVYGLANWMRYALADPGVALLGYLGGMSWKDLPIGGLVWASGLGVLWSPWFILVELLIGLRLVPIALGYWLASQDEEEAYSQPTLLVTLLALLGLLYVGFQGRFSVTALGAALAILLAFVSVEMAWRRVAAVTAAVGSGGARIQQLRARTQLSQDLAIWLSITVCAFYFAAIDTIGYAIYYAYGENNAAFVSILGALVGALVAGLPILRGAAQFLANRTSNGTGTATWSRFLGNSFVSAIIALLLLAGPLLVISLLSHALFARLGIAGAAAVAVFALVISFIIAWPWAVILINRTSLQAFYAARLARAYLGATNPNRAGTSVDGVVPGDDVEALHEYRPHAAGGPLHLINVCINQTIDQGTLRRVGDRFGMSMACSPLAISIGKYFHAKWNVDFKPEPLAPSGREKMPAAMRAQSQQDVNQPAVRGKPDPRPLEALGHVRGTPHPLLGADGQPPDVIELLPLRDWIAISGAAFSPGMGSETNPALSVLFLLANIRIGYWWNSGLTAGDRGARPEVSFLRRVLWLLPKVFETQTRLIAEARAQFRGPWDQLWYLSDGGHFEVLGAYELIRRRVRFVIVLDGSATLSGFSNLQRRVRTDFGAEISHFGKARWGQAVDAAVKAAGDAEKAKPARADWDRLAQFLSLEIGDGGPFDCLLRGEDVPSAMVKKHATLYQIDYPGGDSSVMLYISASLSGDEPLDVIDYRAHHPDFPQESTADQFFDEAQWESYRRLGEHIGDQLFGLEPKRPPPATGRRDLWLTELKELDEPQQ